MFKCVLYDCMSQLLSDTATRNIIIQSHACVQLIDLVKSKIGEYADYHTYTSLYISLNLPVSVTSQHLLFRNILCGYTTSLHYFSKLTNQLSKKSTQFLLLQLILGGL